MIESLALNIREVAGSPCRKRGGAVREVCHNTALRDGKMPHAWVAEMSKHCVGGVASRISRDPYKERTI